MSGLKAALYKDLKLFFSGAGVAALLLPFLLLAAFRIGLGDLTTQSYVQPFPSPCGMRTIPSCPAPSSPR